MRKKVVPEELFLAQIELIIKNLFVTNVNFRNGYYNSRPIDELISDNRERAKFIIDEMHRTKHLIGIGDKE